MSYFNRDSRGGGGRSFGRRSFGDRGGRGGRGDREMFSVICSECGKECQVPFRPTGSKPVYCSECFEKKGGGEPRRFGDRGDRGDRQPQNNQQLEAISAKLDKILARLESMSVKPASEVKIEKEEEIKEEPIVIVKKKRASKKVVLAPEE